MGQFSLNPADMRQWASFSANQCFNVTHATEKTMASAQPPNFSWVDPGKVAGLAMPRMTAHYQYLLDNGVKHLVTLCERKPPYHDTCPDLTLHHIKIHDFCAPTFDQIKRFLSIVEEASARGQVKHSSCTSVFCKYVLSISVFVYWTLAGCCGALFAWFWPDGDDARLLPGEEQENQWNRRH